MKPFSSARGGGSFFSLGGVRHPTPHYPIALFNNPSAFGCRWGVAHEHHDSDAIEATHQEGAEEVSGAPRREAQGGPRSRARDAFGREHGARHQRPSG